MRVSNYKHNFHFWVNYIPLRSFLNAQTFPFHVKNILDDDKFEK